VARFLFRHNYFLEYSVVFLLMGLLALVLLTLDRNTGFMQPLRQYFRSHLLDVYAVFHGANSEFNQGVTARHERSEMLATIDQLKREREELLVRQRLELPQLERENSQLRDLLNLTDVYSDGLVVARQIRSMQGANDGRIYINVGETSQVRLSQPVLSAKGLVGQIDELFTEYSRVLPIIHPGHAISVQVRNKLTRFIAQGDGDGLVIKDIPKRADIRAGDELATTGLGDIYPQLYPVGKVARIARKKGDLKDVYIEPYADFSEIRFVVVVYQRHFGPGIP